MNGKMIFFDKCHSGLLDNHLLVHNCFYSEIVFSNGDSYSTYNGDWCGSGYLETQGEVYLRVNSCSRAILLRQKCSASLPPSVSPLDSDSNVVTLPSISPLVTTIPTHSPHVVTNKWNHASSSSQFSFFIPTYEKCPENTSYWYGRRNSNLLLNHNIMCILLSTRIPPCSTIFLYEMFIKKN